MPGNLPSIDSSDAASWPTPNYVDPEERTWLLPYSITITGASSILVLVRICLRLRHEGGGMGLDDVRCPLSKPASMRLLTAR